MPHDTVPTRNRGTRPEPHGARRPALRLVVGGGDGAGAAVGAPPAMADELWRQVDELAGVVRLVQAESEAAYRPDGPAPVGPPPDFLRGDPRLASLAALFEGGEETEDALTEALAFSELYEVLVGPGGPEEIRRTGHPEAGTVLEVAARVLPDRRLAREARKSALKARTHRVCG